MSGTSFRSIVALSGGVGGARFADGLAKVAGSALTVVVNTGDDFVHWGLTVSPDVDTVMYTLGGLSDDERGWGLRGETFETLERVRAFGGPAWFMLGDRDLATHLTRTDALARGETLTQITARLVKSVGIAATILPMSDGPCRTMIHTAEDGVLSFQEWFVGRRAAPRVRRVEFVGNPPATHQVLDALRSADLVVIGPSNPFVSIDPILSRPGVSDALVGRRVIAVSPIVGGRAVKGPLAEMIPSLVGDAPSAAAVANYYGELLAGFVVEHGDEAAISGLRVHATDTIMKTRADRERLAAEVLSFAESLR